jgi:P-type Ca2+ transporter type 2C
MLMAGTALCLQAWSIKNDLHWQTMVFNFLCLAQFAHVLAIRSGNDSFFQVGLFSNKMLVAGIVISLALQTVITFVPFFQPIFQTEALTLSEFIIVGACASIVFFAVEIEKLVSRKRLKRGPG